MYLSFTVREDCGFDMAIKDTHLKISLQTQLSRKAYNAEFPSLHFSMPG